MFEKLIISPNISPNDLHSFSLRQYDKKRGFTTIPHALIILNTKFKLICEPNQRATILKVEQEQIIKDL